MPTLKDLRERALLSQIELSRAVGVTHDAVYSWESGRKSPTPEHRRRLVDIFKCTPDELLAALKETQALRKERDKPPEDEKERAAA
jgi:transcriptional regulator with XRE-family HTH domain